MKMDGEKIINAPKQEVWDALNNPEKLKLAIPGAENVEKKDVEEQNSEDFFFNQDIDYNEGIRSPGWARLQSKKLKRRIHTKKRRA